MRSPKSRRPPTPPPWKRWSSRVETPAAERRQPSNPSPKWPRSPPEGRGEPSPRRRPRPAPARRARGGEAGGRSLARGDPRGPEAPRGPSRVGGAQPSRVQHDMLLVDLTGGIGSGKSTVAELLAERGAAVIDADDLARRAVAPGDGRFRSRGGDVRSRHPRAGRRHRPLRLAAIVFGDPTRLRALESIVHPEVARLYSEALEPFRDTDRIVVYSVPLLAERGLAKGFDVSSWWCRTSTVASNG